MHFPLCFARTFSVITKYCKPTFIYHVWIVMQCLFWNTDATWTEAKQIKMKERKKGKKAMHTHTYAALKKGKDEKRAPTMDFKQSSCTNVISIWTDWNAQCSDRKKEWNKTEQTLALVRWLQGDRSEMLVFASHIFHAWTPKYEWIFPCCHSLVYFILHRNATTNHWLESMPVGCCCRFSHWWWWCSSVFFLLMMLKNGVSIYA